MKPLPFLTTLLALSLASTHAISAEKPAAEKSTTAESTVDPDAATLKKQLIAAINADIKKSETANPDGINTKILARVLTSLEDPAFQKYTDSPEELRIDGNLRAANASQPTLACCAQWMKKIKQDTEQTTQKLRKELPDIYRNALQRAINAQSADEIDTITHQLTSTYNALPTLERRTSDATISHHSFTSLLEQIKNFHTATSHQDQPNATLAFNQITQSLRNYSQATNLTSEEQNKTFLDVLRKRAGILNTKEIETLADRILNDLLDDANQDRLDQLTEEIHQQQLIISYSTSTNGTKSTNKWAALNSLATSLTQNVSRIQNGGISQFSVERWQSDNSSNKSLIPTKELTKRIRSYQVRMTDENGKPTTQPLIYNTLEILNSIHSLAELRKNLPTLKKAIQYQSNTRSDGFDWSQSIACLEVIASLTEKLDDGKAFPLASEVGYYNEAHRFPTVIPNHPASAKLNALNTELQHRILRRFHPEIPITDTTEPSKIIDKLLEKAKAQKQYQEIIQLNQFAYYFNPGQSTISTQELTIITCMLAGTRQDDEFHEPRLATYYFQKAATTPSTIVPIEDLKKRLQHLKTTFPADYDKGTDDFFKVAADDLNRRFLPTQLIIPATK